MHGWSRLRWACGAVLAVSLVGATPASAHLVTTGLGPFYDGLGHLALTPEDLISVIALGLLAGLRGIEHGRILVLALPAAWLGGGWLGLLVEPQLGPAIGVVSLLLLGALVAADLRWPPGATLALAGAIGLVHGFANGGAMATADGGARAILGVISGVFVLVTLVAAFVSKLQAPWMRIAVRVAGSWIAAVGLLMLGWWLRGSLA